MIISAEGKERFYEMRTKTYGLQSGPGIVQTYKVLQGLKGLENEVFHWYEFWW